MISLKDLFSQMAALVETPERQAPNTLASALSLDMSAATVTKTKSSDFAIVDATRTVFPYAPIVGYGRDRSRRSICLVLDEQDRIVYNDELMRGFVVRIIKSKRADGFTAVATSGRCEFSCVVSTPEQTVSALFCETNASMSP